MERREKRRRGWKRGGVESRTGEGKRRRGVERREKGREKRREVGDGREEKWR